MKRITIALSILLVFSLIPGIAGCGGDDDATPSLTPVPTAKTTPAPSDEELISVIINAEISALNALDLETVYNYKTPGYRSRVTLEEYTEFMEAAWADYLGLAGTAQLEVQDICILVEGDWGYMKGKLALDGLVLLEYTDESPDVLHKIDGIWYDVEEDPMDPGYDAGELPGAK